MIKVINGSILNAKTDFIMHQVNCQGEINSGVAKALVDFNKGIFTHYKSKFEQCKKYNIKLLGDNDYVNPSVLYQCLHRAIGDMTANDIQITMLFGHV